MDQEPNTEFKPKMTEEGYRKRPVWQWIVLYVIVAAALYGIIYWIFMLAGY
jgi:hypothetical protein